MYSADEMRQKPVRITGNGEIFIGGEQVLANYPIASEGISVKPVAHHRLNTLTVTLVVGEVTMELKEPRVQRGDDECGCSCTLCEAGNHPASRKCCSQYERT